MASVVVIDDPGDARLRDYLALTDTALRRVSEPADGLFIAESSKVVRRCLAAGYVPRSAITSPRWLSEAVELFARVSCNIFVVPDDVIEAVTGFQVHRGVLASMHRRPLASVADVVGGALLIAVLVDLVDHTNVGAAFRSAAALGVDAILVTPECADPLYRRSLRVSMGTVLHIPWTRAHPWPDCLDVLRSEGFRLAALTPAADSVDLRTVAPELSRQRTALIFGTEGAGLAADVVARCDLRIRIPMRPGVDSLNVAAASAVAFYAVGESIPGGTKLQHGTGQERTNEGAEPTGHRIVD